MLRMSSCFCMSWCRFTSIRGENPIDTVSCASPRSCKMVQGGRTAFPARGWSCLQCCALKQVTMWPLSSMAAQILPGSSLTAWPIEMVCINNPCCDIKHTFDVKAMISSFSIRKPGNDFFIKNSHQCYIHTMLINYCQTLIMWIWFCLILSSCVRDIILFSIILNMSGLS